MNNQNLKTKWKILNEVKRLIFWPVIRSYFFIHGIKWNHAWKIYGCPVIQKHSESTIAIGKNFCMRNFFGSNPLGPLRPILLSTRNANSKIVIGDDVGISGGQICADVSIKIGDRVLIGANCIIVDTDFHPTHPQMRIDDPKAGSALAVVIEEDVFIGMNSIILKGVRIGRGSCIGAGSVVTKDVPPNVIFAGNPAKFIREIESNNENTND